jgi:hypothetical protein
LTVGYGDIKPTSRASKILSVLVSGIGIMLSGLLVAITLKATTMSFYIHKDPEVMETIKRNFN